VPRRVWHAPHPLPPQRFSVIAWKPEPTFNRFGWRASGAIRRSLLNALHRKRRRPGFLICPFTRLHDRLALGVDLGAFLLLIFAGHAGFASAFLQRSAFRRGRLAWAPRTVAMLGHQCLIAHALGGCYRSSSPHPRHQPWAGHRRWRRYCVPSMGSRCRHPAAGWSPDRHDTW